MATRPHVSFTLYDDATLAWHAITKASFEKILMAQQFVFRAIGIFGLYLLAGAMGFNPSKALLVTAIVSLGATVAGPAVLTVEYEPVPRGFSLPFLILSLACVGWERWRWAAACATIAFAFHPPTAIPHCSVLFLILLYRRRFLEIGILAAGPVVMLADIIRTGAPKDGHPLFGRVDPALEPVLRLRASYNWVGMWFRAWMYNYVFLWTAGMLALWRLRRRLPRHLMLFFATLPAIGLLSVPLSYVLLEGAKWLFIAQYQPGRYLLFVSLAAALLCTAAGIHAAERSRWPESILFFTVALAIPMEAKVTNVLFPYTGSTLAMKRLLIAILLAGCSAMAIALMRRRAGWLYPVAAALLPFVLIPGAGGVRNYPPLHTPGLDELARWARDSTPKDALFQFADAGRDLPPGVFRARARRALYADWKAGGQVNFLKSFSPVWWERWQKIEKPQPLSTYRELGIDYVVFRTGNAPPQAAPVYSNSEYSVFKLN